MNGKYFTHVLLLLAMLTGQMATNAHMIDHMADHAPVAAIDCDVALSHSEERHHDGSNLEGSGSNNSNSECSIYHAYAGANGIAPEDRNDNVLNTKSILLKQSLPTQITAQTLSTHLIRGPPLYS